MKSQIFCHNAIDVRVCESKSMRQQASYGAFMPSIELFDSRRFRITRGEAAIMDPGQRLLLEAI